MISLQGGHSMLEMARIYEGLGKRSAEREARGPPRITRVLRASLRSPCLSSARASRPSQHSLKYKKSGVAVALPLGKILS